MNYFVPYIPTATRRRPLPSDSESVSRSESQGSPTPTDGDYLHPDDFVKIIRRHENPVITSEASFYTALSSHSVPGLFTDIPSITLHSVPGLFTDTQSTTLQSPSRQASAASSSSKEIGNTWHQNALLTSRSYRIQVIVLVIFLPPVAVLLVLGCNRPGVFAATLGLWIVCFPLAAVVAYCYVVMGPLVEVVIKDPGLEAIPDNDNNLHD